MNNLDGFLTPIQSQVQQFIGHGKKHLVYEYITNFTNIDIKMDKKINIEKLIIKQNETIIYLFLTFNENFPETLENIFYINNQLITKYIAITYNPIIIHPPLQGNHWYAADGPSNDSSHRTVIINHLIPQRFAIDFIQYGSEGLTYGDPLINHNYYAYKQPILSVVNGKVIALKTNIPDNIPAKGGSTIPGQHDLDNLAGNYIILFTNHCYILYAHLSPNSITVKVGDPVNVGQILGLLGNSGNSEFPHLHFQIMQSSNPSPLNGQGIPWHMTEFMQENYFIISMHQTIPIPYKIKITDTQLIKNEIIMDKMLVSFKVN